MDSWIAQTSSLPNLHAALVHFPLALLPLAAGFDLACLLRRRAWLDRAATLLWALGGLAAWAAVAAGERAADTFAAVPPRVQPAIGEHSDWAHWTLYLVAAVAVARLALWWRDRAADRPSMLPVRWLALLAAVAGLGLLVATAEHGGALVYEHGLGVQSGAAAVGAVRAPTPASSPPGTAAASESVAGAPPGSRSADGESAAHAAATDAPEAGAAAEATPSAPERRPDGSLVWRPGPGDGGAVGTVLLPAAGTSADAVHAEASEDGLRLHVTGTALLLLPETFGDVQVDAEVAFEGFQGTVGVAHHVAGDAGGLFTLGSDGLRALIDRRSAGDEVLDSAEGPAPEGTVTLSVSAAGRHLKGLVDGETVTHGHVEADPPGGCGLRLDGEGTVRLVSLTVTPLAEH